jgi:hypothetical protein
LCPPRQLTAHRVHNGSGQHKWGAARHLPSSRDEFGEQCRHAAAVGEIGAMAGVEIRFHGQVLGQHDLVFR